nr:hypothetical protein [Bacteroidales bacterium]
FAEFLFTEIADAKLPITPPRQPTLGEAAALSGHHEAAYPHAANEGRDDGARAPLTPRLGIRVMAVQGRPP